MRRPAQGVDDPEVAAPHRLDRRLVEIGHVAGIGHGPDAIADRPDRAVRLIESHDRHRAARAIDRPGLSMRRDRHLVQNSRIALLAVENVGEPSRQRVACRRVHPGRDAPPRPHGEDTKIIDSMNLIGMIMGVENGVDMPNPGRQHLGAQIRRGVDQHAGHALRPVPADQQRAAGAIVLRLRRIAIAPVAIAARHAAGRAAAENDDFELSALGHAPSGRGMRSNRAKKASVVRASASSRLQPRISASLSSTWVT